MAVMTQKAKTLRARRSKKKERKKKMMEKTGLLYQPSDTFEGIQYQPSRYLVVVDAR